MTKKKTAKRLVRRAKRKTKARVKTGLTIISFKAAGPTKRLIDRKARQHFEGNVSALIRTAVKNYKPRRGEKLTLKAA